MRLAIDHKATGERPVASADPCGSTPSKGDDGTTGLLFGGRVAKTSARIELNGAVDEAQAALGLARAEAEPRLRARRAAGGPRARPLRADGRGGHGPREPAASWSPAPRWSPPRW